MTQGQLMTRSLLCVTDTDGSLLDWNYVCNLNQLLTLLLHLSKRIWRAPTPAITVSLVARTKSATSDCIRRWSLRCRKLTLPVARIKLTHDGGKGRKATILGRGAYMSRSQSFHQHLVFFLGRPFCWLIVCRSVRAPCLEYSSSS